jgi:uncharacterized protein
MKNLQWIVLVCVLAVCTLHAEDQSKFPLLKQRVNDFTNTLSFQEWQEVDRLLKSYEDTTSTQIVVLMVNSLEGESLEDYANKTFAINKIGQAKKDNGVLLLIAKQDRQVRIEVGYGLEGALTDAISSQIIDKEIRPHFKANNYFGGIVTGVDAIIRTTKGEYQADNKGKKAPAVSVGLIMLAIFFGVFVFLPMLSSRRRSIIGSNGHQYFSGWGYGGGFGSGGGFGGGGGGFSGGGGMSGGGGASGSW